jgi:two-component system, OmpR family, sensor kinase
VSWDDDTIEGRPAIVGVPRNPRAAETPGGSLASSRRLRLRNAARSALASYRLRIVGWYVLLLAVGSLATIFVVGQLLFQRVDAGIRATLEREVEEFRVVASGNDPATGQPFGSNVARMFDVFLEGNITPPNEIVVTFVNGQVYATSPEPRYALDLDAAFTATVATTTTVVTGRLNTPVGDVEYVAVPVRVDGQNLGVFSISAFRDLARSEQEGIFIGALVVGLMLLLIGSLLAWRLADRLLEPVAQTSATARTITETDLSQRVEVRGHDEVADLARTLNEMLDRLESAFEGQRRFLDDVGHELRTPLTIVRGHLELMDDGSPEERASTRELVLDELDRMARLVNDLITLAQSARSSSRAASTRRRPSSATATGGSSPGRRAASRAIRSASPRRCCSSLPTRSATRSRAVASSSASR